MVEPSEHVLENRLVRGQERVYREDKAEVVGDTCHDCAEDCKGHKFFAPCKHYDCEQEVGKRRILDGEFCPPHAYDLHIGIINHLVGKDEDTAKENGTATQLALTLKNGEYKHVACNKQQRYYQTCPPKFHNQFPFSFPNRLAKNAKRYIGFVYYTPIAGILSIFHFYLS